MTILFSPWFWLAVVLTALSLLGTGFHHGYKYAKADTAREQVAAQIAADEQARKQAEIDRETEQAFEAVREEVRTVYITVKEKADENIDQNPAYAECGLDDNGLRLYNSKPGTTQPHTASGLYRTVPGPAASDER